MATKDITDRQVCEAVQYVKDSGLPVWPVDVLEKRTGECQKVCQAAMERAARRGYIEYGVSLRSGWLTTKGHDLLQGAST